MIVDDERIVRQGLVNIIPWQKLGFQVVAEAASFKDALKCARKTAPDVLLTDIRLQDGSGLDLIIQLQKELPALRSVIISGYSEFDYAVRALQLRVEDYILKPIDPDVIQRVFQRIANGISEDTKKQSQQKSANYVLTEYEMLLRFHYDMDSTDFTQRYLYGVDRYHVALIRQLSYHHTGSFSEQNNISPVSLKQSLIDYLREFYFIATDGLILALIPERIPLKQFAQGLLSAFAEDAADYRMIFSDEAHGPSGGVSAYLAASSLLYHADGQQIVYPRQDHQRNDQENLTALRKKLVEKLESGKLIDTTLQQIVANAVQSSDPRGLYLHVLQEVTRYFQIDDWQPSEILRHVGTHPVTSSERGSIDLAFQSDMKFLENTIRNCAGSMANILAVKAVKEIEQFYADPAFNLSHLASKFNVSYGYLSSVFSKIIGKGFSSYLVEIRMNKAKALLLKRDLKIYEIAYLVGYSNPKYFSDAFRKSIGMSPHEYLARIGGNAND